MKDAILVVDDEAGVRSSLAGILGDEGYAVTSVESGEAGLAALEARRYDLVLLDVWLPGLDGLEVLRRIRERDAELPVVVISGHGTIETAVKAVRLGAQDFVEKPLSLEKTVLAVKNALRQRRLESQLRELRQQLDARYAMVGESLYDNAALLKGLESVIDTDPYCFIHTSGSTGIPKGVALNHRCTIDFVDWAFDRLNLDGSEVMGSLAPIAANAAANFCSACLPSSCRSGSDCGPAAGSTTALSSSSSDTTASPFVRQWSTRRLWAMV